MDVVLTTQFHRILFSYQAAFIKTERNFQEKHWVSCNSGRPQPANLWTGMSKIYACTKKYLQGSHVTYQVLSLYPGGPLIHLVPTEQNSFIVTLAIGALSSIPSPPTPLLLTANNKCCQRFNEGLKAADPVMTSIYYS